MKITIKISNLVVSLLAVLALVSVNSVYAANTTLVLTQTGSGDNVRVDVTGNVSSSVILVYTKTSVGTISAYLGNTNTSGSFSVDISTSAYDVASGSSVYVTVGGINGIKSSSVVWPVTSTTGTLSLSQTAVSLIKGQSTTITGNNTGTGTLYVSNNSNPSVANVNISGSQITVTGNIIGSTTASICLQGDTTTLTPSCASIYILVGTTAVQPLTFSINTLTVSPGQSVPITVSGGTGTYSVLNNSNSSVIQTNISGSIITLSTNSTSGTSAITVCSSDMSSCGIINATASTASTNPIAFNQTNPVLSVGQSTTIVVTGGTSSVYYISANSNATSVAASISSNNLILTGNSNGTSIVTVCSASGGCGALTVTVNYVSSGGTLTLSQTSLSLLIGQVFSVTISGGTSPYSISPVSGADSIFQSSLSSNIITLSGISVGSSSVNVCSAGGACTVLTVTVNGSGSGTPITFSQNNISLTTGAVTAVIISGGGGYYVSSNSNSSVATVQINSSTAIVTAGITAGSDNISICQSSGQCLVLFITVQSGSTTTSLPVFSQSSPSLAINQVTTVTISGGVGTNYYVASNSTPNVAAVSLNSSTLTITGQASGSTAVVVCAASTNCGVLMVYVSNTVYTAPTTTTSTSTTSTTVHFVGTNILTTDGTISMITADGTRRPYTSAGAFLSYGFNSFATVVKADTADIALPQGSFIPPRDGKIVCADKGTDKGTCYLITNGKKAAFTSATIFKTLGFSFANSLVGDVSFLSSTPLINSDTAQHLPGTLINKGGVIYLVGNSGLLGIPSMDVLNSWGYSLSDVVKANTADSSLTQSGLVSSHVSGQLSPIQ